MTKKEVIKALENADYASGIADVVCNITRDGKTYENESMLVLLCGYGEDDSACDDDQILMNEHWCVCEGIGGFKSYLRNSINESFEFVEVKPFVSDFGN